MSVIEDNWNYCRDKCNMEKSFLDFETSIMGLLNKIEDGMKTQTFLYNLSGTENQDDELKALVENNKELRQHKDKKLEEISLQMVQYEKLKKDQSTLKQEIKKTHEAFLMAKKYYKKFLKMYYTVESKNGENQTIFVQFFTEAKKDSNNFSVHLLRNTNTGHYQLIGTTPKLSISEDFKRKLQESNDVPGVLCYIRQAFIEINTKKTKTHNTKQAET